MGAVAAEVRSTATATADLLVAATGLAMLCYPAVFLANSLLGSPVANQTVRLLVGVLAFGGAYPFVAGDWTLATLWESVFAFLLAAIAFEIAIGTAVLVLGIDAAAFDPAPRALAFAGAYVVASLTASAGGFRWPARNG